MQGRQIQSLENPPSLMSLQSVSLSLVIPAHNEEMSVAQVVKNLSENLTRSGPPFEIIVIDDGSTDATAKAAEGAGARVIRHAVNRGYGASLKLGIGEAQNDWIAITDADGTYPNERIQELLATAIQRKSDMVVGARVGKKVKMPWIRRPARWFLHRLSERVTGEAIPDANSGLRVFQKKAVLRFFNLLPDGFSFTTTLTLAMLTNGYRVHFLPIDYHPRTGRSKIRPVRDTLNFIGLVLRVALYFAPLKIFLPLSGLLILGAVGWGLYTKFALGLLADVTTIVIGMTGIQIGVIGLLAELINQRLPNRYQENQRE